MPSERKRQLITALRYALPANTAAEIAARMSPRLREPITDIDVYQLKAYLNRKYETYGWLIAPVKRGKPRRDGVSNRANGRWYALDKQPDGSFYFDDVHRQHFDGGTHSTVATIATQSRNMASQLATAILHERSSRRREMLEDLEENLDYVARRTARILRDIPRHETAAA
jgi:hypothetical protein